MKISAYLLLFILAVLSQGLAQVPKTDDLLDEMEQTLLADKGSTPWWNKEWSLRRRVRIVDPGFDLLRGTVVVLAEPSPLLLYNTGRANRGLADLRATDMAGKPLRCGVYQFGQDDGTSAIWVDLTTESGGGLKGPRGKGATLMLYYGNARAPAPEGVPPPYFPFAIGNPELDRRVRPALQVELGPEELLPGHPPRAAITAADFFANTLLLEAEDFKGPNGERVEGVYGKRRYLLKFESESASGRWMMAPDKSWHPGYVRQTYPVWCYTTAQLPTGGTWYVHARYVPTQYAKPEMAKTRRGAPFTLQLGGREFRCGEDETPGARYRYTSFAVDLPAGENRIGLRFDGVSTIDCLILTTFPDYLPDLADLNGPVWMRFQVVDQDQPPCFMELFCMITPWSSHGPQGKPAGWLFKGRVEKDEPTYRKLAADRELYLKPGEWTPWIQTLDSTMPLWWSNARVYGKLAPRMASRTGLSLAYQFAMRPDEGRVFRQGTGVIHAAGGLPIIMSNHRSAPAIVRRTMTFDEWSASRFRRVQELKIEPVPKAKSIYVNTMATVFSPRDAEQTARTLSWLGFNCLNLRCDAKGVDEGAVLEQEGVPFLLGFGGGDAPLHEVDLPVRPPAGGSALDQLDEVLAANADRRWTEIAARMPASMRERLRVMKTGDEIGAATSHHFINPHPFLLACYREFLQRQGLTPEFFGAASWDEVRAVGYGELSDKGLAYLDASLAKVDPDRAKRRDEERAQREEGESLLTLGLDHIPEIVLDDPGAEPDSDAPPAGEGEAPPAAPATNAPPAPPLPPLFERRGYHYTQKFRSLATAMSYGKNNAALLRHVSDRILAAPNFQAMPCQKGQMWDGSINIFDMGRHPFGNTLLLEDWTTSPHKVAFGMSLIAAAARKRNLALASYLVEGRMMNRALIEVGLGLRSMTSYLYGPLRVIGPPWAEHEETILQFAALNRWIARFEDPLLSSTLRPCDAAILVACTSELNARYFDYPLIERSALYAFLQNARVPVEIVGEEEVLEDNALSRYRLLYVVDPHVASRAQAKIREWVQAGGVLWAGPAAAAWQEFHEPSAALNDALGLASRGLPAPMSFAYTMELAGPKLVVPSNSLYAAVTCPTVGVPPEFAAGTAETVASFDNGKPAILRNRFGKGQAFFHAFPMASFTGGYGKLIDQAEGAGGRRRILQAPAEVAGVRHQVESESPDLLTFVRDGKDFSLLVVANGQNDEPVRDARIRVILPFRPAMATDGQGAPVAFEAGPDSASLTVNFEPRWGAMILFRP